MPSKKLQEVIQCQPKPSWSSWSWVVQPFMKWRNMCQFWLGKGVRTGYPQSNAFQGVSRNHPMPAKAILKLMTFARFSWGGRAFQRSTLQRSVWAWSRLFLDVIVHVWNTISSFKVATSFEVRGRLAGQVVSCKHHCGAKHDRDFIYIYIYMCVCVYLSIYMRFNMCLHANV